jgi:hypothetical protein
MVGKVGLPPPLDASQSQRGQAALPDHELFDLEFLFRDKPHSPIIKQANQIPAFRVY